MFGNCGARKNGSLCILGMIQSNSVADVVTCTPHLKRTTCACTPCTSNRLVSSPKMFVRLSERSSMMSTFSQVRDNLNRKIHSHVFIRRIILFQVLARSTRKQRPKIYKQRYHHTKSIIASMTHTTRECLASCTPPRKKNSLEHAHPRKNSSSSPENSQG